MGKIAFVFPGQGAQYPGMGRELFEISPAAKKLFETAEAIRPGTIKQCFEGTKEELAETKNTQPCLFLTDLAAALALMEKGVSADMAAGFSLGELAALTFSGAIGQEDGFKLVCERGRLMQEASEGRDTAMAAVMKLESARVEELCAAYGGVYPVNYNCPGQITVAGLKEELAALGKDVKAAGGRALPLAVSGAFHSPFMAKAAAGLDSVLENISLSAPVIPIYSNYTAKPYGENARELLVNQAQNPVRWQETIENMIKAGADIFIEAGAGKTLCGLIKKISPDARVFNAEDAESLKKTVWEVKGGA